MNGHSTPTDQAAIVELERDLDLRRSVIERLVRLAELYIEPAHREADAIRLLEAVLIREPQNSLARIWLAYCCIHYLMNPESLRRAVELLKPLHNSESLSRAAALMLAAEALEELGELPVTTKIELLVASTTEQSHWVSNHARLAWAYHESERHDLARKEMQQAVANLKGEDTSTANRAFDICITEILGEPRFYQEQLERMIQAK